MTHLPIMVETNAWQVMLFGVILCVTSLGLVQAARWSDDMKTAVGAASGAVVTGLLGLALIVQNLGWQLRMDEKGIALRAPFDLMRPGGEIAWSDMTSVEVLDRPHRGSSSFLRVRGQHGQEIQVANADMLPRQFGLALQKIVAERAPQVRDINELAAQFELARTTSTSILGASYSARDGRGNPLR